ncbi:amidase [Roseateles sp. GG27B]
MPTTTPVVDAPSPISGLQWGALFAGAVIDPLDAVERTLADIAACDDPAVFIQVCAERARGLALASQRRHASGQALGPLDGVPVAWKDLFDLKGEITTAGALCLDQERPALDDAQVVHALEAAGMVSVGRVNMSEFAFSGLGLNPHYGTPRNPHSPPGDARAPGGSSSGSAVVVARGLVPISIGSDTGGSVRIPAAFNGIVGYKASSGRYPMQGVFPLSHSLDSLGVLCTSAADAAAVDGALRQAPLTRIRPATLVDVRLVVPTNVVLDDCEPAVLTNFEAALHWLEQTGTIVERRPIAAFDDIMALIAQHGAIVTSEAYALHRQRLEGAAAARMDQRVVARVRLGANISAASYEALLQARQRLIAETAADLGNSLVACPTVAHTAPSIAALEADDALFVATNIRTLRNTMLGNFLDWCGISLPNGADADGLPTGLMLCGVHGSDDRLLAIAQTAQPVVCPRH